MYRVLDILKVFIVCVISVIAVGQTENLAYSDNKLFINDKYIPSENNMYTYNDTNYIKLDLLKELGIDYEFSSVKSLGIEMYKFGKKGILLINNKIIANNIFSENNVITIDDDLYIAVRELKNLNKNFNIDWIGEYKLVWVTNERNVLTKNDILLANPKLFGIKDIDGVFEPLNSNKVAYITFDDGPSSKVTPTILDILKEYNVKATFFVNGVNIGGKEDVLRRIVNEGHTIGNHTYSHKSSLYNSLDSFKSEVDSTNNMIYEITGVKCRAFRAPYGNKLKQAYKDYLKSQDMTTYYWNVDPGDSVVKNITSSQIISKVQSQVANKNGDVIVILHDMNNKIQTQNAVRGVIKVLWSNGFKTANLNPDIPYNGTATVY